MRFGALIGIIFLGWPTIASAQPPADSAVSREILAIEHQLLDAIAPGDTSVWLKYVSDGCLFTVEEGEFLTKAELIGQLRPLPQGYSGTIEMKDIHFWTHNDVSVIAYLADENETIFSQKINTQYRITDTYARETGQWKLVASEILAIPKHPPPVKVDPAILERYVGEYELAEGTRYVVTKDGERLMGQRTGRKAVLMSAENDFTFFVPGSRGTKVFVKDVSGKVTGMLDRRDGNDLVWRRVR